MNADLELARAILKAQNKTLVLVRDGTVLGTGERPGVVDLVDLAERLGEKASGAALADRVVGKAAGLIAQCMGVSSIYASLASEAARERLAEEGISLEYERLVPGILNRKGDGPCPFERLVAGIEDPGEALKAIRSFIGALSPPAPRTRPDP